jgi:hypothetical protein
MSMFPPGSALFPYMPLPLRLRGAVLITLPNLLKTDQARFEDEAALGTH